MDKNNNSIIRLEENGVEYFTIVATGESGLSISGVARLSEIPRTTLTDWLKDLGENQSVKGLESLVGKALYLDGNANKKGGKVKIVRASIAFDILEFAAFERKSKVARQVLKESGVIGIDSYIQGKTGWLPEQYQSSKEARSQLNRIMDAPRPFKPLFGDESVQKVSNLTGYPRTSIQIANWFWKYVYYILNSSERAKLNQLNPVLPAGYRKQTIHQWLDENLAEDRKEHFRIIEMLIELARTQQEFDEMFQRKFHKVFQLSLFN